MEILGLTLMEVATLKKDAELHGGPDYMRLLRENVRLAGKVAIYEARLKEMVKVMND
jgi:hypothetical protein